MKNKNFIIAGCILALFGVGIGAFGAHAFKDALLQHAHTDTFETANRYLFYHALALILIGIIDTNKYTNWSGKLLLVGTLIFCLSLYAICITHIKTFGAVAPIGGSLMIVGWASAAYGVYKSKF